MPSKSTIEHYKWVLETQIAEAERIIANAEQEVRASSVKHADAADQAAAEYERQASTFKAIAARQTLRSLQQALERIRQGTFGGCVQCGSEIEPKRLEAIPWARYCLKCRCVMTTLPQADLPQDHGILRAAAKYNQQYVPALAQAMPSVGVYANVLRSGAVRRGDRLRMQRELAVA